MRWDYAGIGNWGSSKGTTQRTRNRTDSKLEHSPVANIVTGFPSSPYIRFFDGLLLLVTNRCHFLQDCNSPWS